VVEQVDNLLLPEVTSAGHADRRQRDRAQLLLEPLGIGAGREEEDDLARSRRARVDELAHPGGDVPGLGPAPGDTRIVLRALVGDEQLERRPERRLAVAGGRLERLELATELVAEELVDGGEHFRA